MLAIVVSQHYLYCCFEARIITAVPVAVTKVAVTQVGP